MSHEEEELEYVESDVDDAQPSYAYLLDKGKERVCRKDLAYCTRDEDGNPTPFCFQYPDDEECDQNTIPPNILFMGCYDDPTCGGKPLGATTVKKKQNAAPQQEPAQPRPVITIVKKKEPTSSSNTLLIVLLVVAIVVLVVVLSFLYRRYYRRRRMTSR